MKKKEWNEGLNHLDHDLVEKYVEQKDRLRQKKQKTKGIWLRFGAISACFLLIVSAVIVVPMLREDDPGNHRPLHWSDVSSLFGEIGGSENVGSPSDMYEKAFHEINSGIYANYKSGSIISDDYVEEKVDAVVIRTGWYQSWNGKERDVYEVNAEVYQIKGIDTKIAVAIKYLEKPHADTTEYFYVYSNPYGCEANSLAEFFEAYNAEQYMNVYTTAHIREFNNALSTNRTVYHINENALHAINTQLLNLNSAVSYSKYTDTNIKKIESVTNACKEQLQLSVELQSAGRRGIVYVLDNGYICFMGFGDFFALHDIGSDVAQALINVVKNNSVCINPSVNKNDGHII